MHRPHQPDGRLNPAIPSIALERRTKIGTRPDSTAPEGLVFLWPLTADHLVKGKEGLAAPPGAWLGVTWTRQGYRLDAIGAGWTLAPADGRWIEVPHVDLAERITASLQGTRAVLEAVALAVRFDLEVLMQRDLGGGNLQWRRLRAMKLNPDAQVLVAHDLERDAPRSFKLSDILAVESTALAEDGPRWTWDRGYIMSEPR